MSSVSVMYYGFMFPSILFNSMFFVLLPLAVTVLLFYWLMIKTPKNILNLIKVPNDSLFGFSAHFIPTRETKGKLHESVLKSVADYGECFYYTFMNLNIVTITEPKLTRKLLREVNGKGETVV